LRRQTRRRRTSTELERTKACPDQPPNTHQKRNTQKPEPEKSRNLSWQVSEKGGQGTDRAEPIRTSSHETWQKNGRQVVGTETRDALQSGQKKRNLPRQRKGRRMLTGLVPITKHRKEIQSHRRKTIRSLASDGAAT